MISTLEFLLRFGRLTDGFAEGRTPPDAEVSIMNALGIVLAMGKAREFEALIAPFIDRLIASEEARDARNN